MQNHLKHRELQERELKKQKNENDSQADHILRLEKLKGKELEELRVKLENQNSLVIEQIKISH